MHFFSFLSAGTNVTYRIQSDEMLLSGLSVFRGNVPQNVTVTPEMMKQPGPGCHQLMLYASNTVTFPEVSTVLQVWAKASWAQLRHHKWCEWEVYVFLCFCNSSYSADVCVGGSSRASGLCVDGEERLSGLSRYYSRCFPRTGCACAAPLLSDWRQQLVLWDQRNDYKQGHFSYWTPDSRYGRYI